MVHDHCLGSCMTSTSMTGDAFTCQSMVSSNIESFLHSCFESFEKLCKYLTKWVWQKIRIRSQKDRRLQGIVVSKQNKQPNLQRKAQTKIFPPICSQSKQIFIFSFVTILSAYGFFCRLPLWSSLCMYKDNKHTFWPSVGWTEM